MPKVKCHCGQQYSVKPEKLCQKARCKKCGDMFELIEEPLPEQTQIKGSGTSGELGESGKPDEMKKCPYCAESVLAAAIKCRFCHEFLNDELKGKRTLDKNANHSGVAAVLAFVVPGLGHIYAGKIIHGIVYSAVIGGLGVGGVVLLTSNEPRTAALLLVLSFIFHMITIREASLLGETRLLGKTDPLGESDSRVTALLIILVILIGIFAIVALLAS